MIILRHAATLAFISWYLIVPVPKTIGDEPQFDAPLSQWMKVNHFETAKQCDEVMTWIQNDVWKHLPKPLTQSEWKKNEPEISAVYAAKCIKSDDPRLKGN